MILLLSFQLILERQLFFTTLFNLICKRKMSGQKEGDAQNSDIVIDTTLFKPKKKYPSTWSNMKEYFSDYASVSTFDGFQYLGDQKRSIIEKLFWAFVLGTSFYLSVILIQDTYTKWNNSPVIVSFAQSPTPVGKIPFPAITICSETKSMQTSFNFTHFYHENLEGQNMTEEERQQFEDISLLCDPHLHKTGRSKTDLNVVDFYTEVAPSFDDTLWQCLWQSKNETCDTLFNPMLSEEGICYTFNMLDRGVIYTKEVYHTNNLLKINYDSKGWSLEKGYDEKEEIDTYPRRAMTAGAKAGLSVLLKAFIHHQDFICRGPVQGFKVSLHNPGEIPRVGNQFFRAPLNQEVIVAIKPDMITTSEGLKNYDPERRGCYFANERPLRYFKEYTQPNCDIECQTNITYKLCDCVSFFMPRTGNTSICGSGSNECVNNAQLKMVSDTSANYSCNCLPACTTLTYSTETSQADFNWKQLLAAFKANVSEFPGIQMTRLRFLYKEMQFIPSERNELYGITDFLANCGGLLGLFTGFSFVTLIETFYFLTLRLCVNIKRYGRHYWSASEELLENDAYIHPYKHEK